jgi:hypothetical protein
MGAQREHYERWFGMRRGPRNLADEAAALAAADAYDAMKSQGKPSRPELDTIVNAAGDAHGLVWNCAADLLSKSLRDWPEVADTIAAMMRARSSTTRFSAMCCVKENMPAQVAREMIKAGLSDKSGQVRWKAGEAANRLKYVEFIPVLERAAAKEKPGRTRDSLEHSLRMLRDGFILNSMGDGTYSLWIDTGRGSVGKSVSESELKAKGVDALVEKFRGEAATR